MLRWRLRVSLTGVVLPAPLTTLPAERLCAGLATFTTTLASLVGRNDQDLRIPACPDWTLRQLATHVGRAHRWAAEIVGTRSAEFIEFRSVPDGKSPPGAEAQAAWLTAGTSRLIDAVGAAGDDRVWAFTALAPARFWARRMAHETLVHMADVQLAVGDVADIPADLATDAIDEWLTVMSPLNAGGNDLASVIPAGTAMAVRVTGPVAAADWLVRHMPGGVQVLPGPARSDVTLAGPASNVLLALMRRIPITTPSVQVSGDANLLDRWLTLTAF
ncbi:MAG: maleylpyruvate isomerase family mycothiol-dependent enzyme [Streptosporangiaceae bacterium]